MRTDFGLDRGIGLWRTLRKRRGWYQIKVHPLFTLLVLVAVGLGLWRDVLVLFTLVGLHEMGHAIMANALGYEVEEVSLLPFGGVAKLSYGGIGFQPRHEALVAIAGPAVNLLLALLSWAMYATGVWSAAFFHQVLQWNVWIVVFNLLPGLPLDGGRILRAARSRRIGYEDSTKEGYLVAMMIAVVLLLLGGLALWSGNPHVGMLILGVFLFVSAWTGRRDTRMDTIRFLDAKRRTEKMTPEIIRALAAPGRAPVSHVVAKFSPDRYHMVYVLGDNGEVRTILEEDELLDAVREGAWTESLTSWLDRSS